MENLSKTTINDVKKEESITSCKTAPKNTEEENLEKLIYDIFQYRFNNISKITLCLSKKAFEYECRKYGLNETIENCGDNILVGHPKTIRVNKPGKMNNCIIGIENAKRMDGISLMGLLLIEINIALDLIAKDVPVPFKDDKDRVIAVSRILETSFRFIKNVREEIRKEIDKNAEYITETVERVFKNSSNISTVPNNLCISIYTDGDFHLSDKSNNPIRNSLPYEYFIKISSKADAEKFAEMFYCNDFGISNPDILKALSYTIEDV